jgi:mRNA interferase MazF
MGRRMNQGDVYWHTFKEPDKRRPVVVLTRDSAIPYLTTVTVAPITSTIRSGPSQVILTEADGLLSECVANCHNLQTVPKSRLAHRIAHLDRYKLRELHEAVAFALGFDATE